MSSMKPSSSFWALKAFSLDTSKASRISLNGPGGFLGLFTMKKKGVNRGKGRLNHEKTKLEFIEGWKIIDFTIKNWDRTRNSPTLCLYVWIEPCRKGIERGIVQHFRMVNLEGYCIQCHRNGRLCGKLGKPCLSYSQNYRGKRIEIYRSVAVWVLSIIHFSPYGFEKYRFYPLTVGDFRVVFSIILSGTFACFYNSYQISSEFHSFWYPCFFVIIWGHHPRISESK